MSVLLERRGHVAVITINRPEKRNAITKAMNDELRDAWRTLETDGELRCAVVTGAGDKAFSVGWDLTEFSQDMASIDWVNGTGLGDLETDETFRKPVICAVEGYCLGRAMTLALSCDIRIASESALFQYPEVKWGTPVFGGAVKLSRLIPRGAAMQMLLTGEPMNAQEAYRVGLVNQVVPNGTAASAAIDLAERIGCHPPLGVQATREIVLRSAHMPARDAYRLGEGLRAAIRRAPEVRDAMVAGLKKRTPSEKKD